MVPLARCVRFLEASAGKRTLHKLALSLQSVLYTCVTVVWRPRRESNTRPKV